MFSSAILRKAAKACGRIGPGVQILLALMCVSMIVVELLGTVQCREGSTFEISADLYVPHVRQRVLTVPFELRRSAEIGRNVWR